jgi:hypothetical protein
MSLKVPFPQHLRSHPRVRLQHPLTPRNKRYHLFKTKTTDPNPIIQNMASLN